MGNVKQSKAVAYLRQICCSGLSSDIVIPEFLRALHHVIPSGRNWYSAIDEQFTVCYQIPDYVIPEMEKMTETVYEAFKESFPAELNKQYAEYYRHYPALTDQRIQYKNYFNESFYNLVYRPLDQHFILEFCVKQHNQVVGLVGLTRPRSSLPFNSQEEALAVRLAPYVAHALAAQGNDTLVYADSGEAGMLVLDNFGVLQYQSDTAHHLLFLSKYPEFVINHSHDDPITAQLQQMCSNLTAIFEEKAAPPPRWSHSNRHGRFNFRAYWLNRQQPEVGGLIGITIERQEPLMLKLLRVLQDTPLSPVQKEVALLLAQSFSNDQIGTRLHIKLTTVKDHVSKIFTKLNLNAREDLLPKLLALANTKDGLRECGFSFDLDSSPRNFH
jgi:DNA-binding CsgD family transcriptional regulator